MLDFHVRRDGAASIIALGKPGNACLSLDDLRRFAEALEAAAADPATAAVVVLAPPGTFCAGGDLADYLACADLDELAAVVRRFLLALAGAEKPLLAAVDGPAIGLGMTMLLHFDAVYATPESTFSAPFADLGLVPEAASTLLAPARFGYLRAFRLLCLGDVISAADAREVGLVSEIKDRAEIAGHVLSVASRLARKPADALRTTRRLLRGDPEAIGRRIELELELFRSRLADPTTVRRLTRISRLGARQPGIAA